MPDISIETMVLQLPGLPEFEARRLALEIADGLAERGVEIGGTIPNLKIMVPADALENKAGLAKRVLAEMIREIRRSS